ncbi:hypothetical protein KAFR_0F01590 [Kazachstania africana CBS 2517]|uniref:Sugar phosphate transporter domain-containing protein n=1 Tax=Kazachstania africana (strain ATCC 22294 / BCRC 22015 / CBS 2517 / CECT 1963 / NBRC 1671 / NRRL Y-8276) TaxID=1071382 RepID=H2AWK6_KAZAF|nr:hypothetical protein KAFR_0F01590 [Kazachstania africana CBS 2517]CCF58756.1 hypothetical protein KAFR_0F01590 [Kazachstania africana CBS 2517]
MEFLDRLKPHVHIIILCICWYTISSLGSQVTKKILTVCPLPLFLGEFQFIYTALLAAISCYAASRSNSIYEIFPVGTFPDKAAKVIITKPSRHIFETVLPLGLFQFVGKYFGHTATSLVPVSTVASTKTLSPVFILLFQKLLRIKTLRFTGVLSFSLISLILGVWIIVREDSKFHRTSVSDGDGYSTYGVFCAIVSMFIFVFQNIYGKKVFTFKSSTLKLDNLHREESPLPLYSGKKVESKFRPVLPAQKYDKLTLMIYISTVGFMLSLGWFLTLEFPVLVRYVIYEEKIDKIEYIPWKLFLLNGTLHFVQAMVTFHLLGELSTLTYSIANLMKRIAIISVSWIIASRSINYLQVFGLLINALGLFLYERCSNEQKLQKLRPE